MDFDYIILNVAHSCTTKAGPMVHTCMMTHMGAWGGAPMALVRQVLRPSNHAVAPHRNAISTGPARIHRPSELGNSAMSQIGKISKK